MAASTSVSHSFVSTKLDGTDTTVVRPSDWNANHTATYDIGQTGSAAVALADKIAESASLTDFAGADPTGATDSSTAINNWLNCGNPYLYLPDGIFTITSGFTYGVIPNGVRKIWGPGTLKWAGTNGFEVILMTSGTTDDLMIEGITLYADHIAFSAVLCFGIFGGPNANIHLKDVKMPESGRFGIFWSGEANMSNLTLDGVEIVNFGQSAIWFGTSVDVLVGSLSDLRITNCLFKGDGNQAHTMLVMNCNGGTNGVFANNVLRTSGTTGTKFGMEISNISNLVISGNDFIDMTDDGCDLVASQGITVKDWVVSNNMLAWTGTPTTGGSGIGLVGAGGTLRDGIVSGNSVKGNGAGGLVLLATSSGTIEYLTLAGNRTMDVNQGINANVSGISMATDGSVGASISNIVAIGNTNISTDNKMVYGIQELAGSPGQVNNNVILRNVNQGGSSGNTSIVGANSYTDSALIAVSQLPAAAANPGLRLMVSNANATTYLSTVAGGGANKVPVISDGTNWIIS